MYLSLKHGFMGRYYYHSYFAEKEIEAQRACLGSHSYKVLKQVIWSQAVKDASLAIYLSWLKKSGFLEMLSSPSFLTWKMGVWIFPLIFFDDTIYVYNMLYLVHFLIPFSDS